MNFISVFLSHSSIDKPLVSKIANQLAQRGIIPWLDQNELTASIDLEPYFVEKVQEQTALVVFLSREALASSWVQGVELKTALELEGKLDQNYRVIPVFLDNPKRLVQYSDLLADRWITESGTIGKNGIMVNQNHTPDEQSAEIAQQIAETLYVLSDSQKKKEVILYLDHRGEGKRKGKPELPENLAEKKDALVLTFRPNISQEATRSLCLHGKAWEETKKNLRWTLSNALGNVQGYTKKNIHILGNAQLAFSFLVGKFFNRATNTDLYCYDRFSPQPFTNAEEDKTTPWHGGDEYADKLDPKKRFKSLASGKSASKVAFVVAKEEQLGSAIAHAQSLEEGIPVIWIDQKNRHTDTPFYKENAHVIELIKDSIAVLQRIKDENGTREIDYYTTLPLSIQPLVASSLHYVIDKVNFMEYRTDLSRSNPKTEDTYISLHTDIG